MAGRQAVRIYTTRFCPYCIRARELLRAKGVGFEDVAVDGNGPLRTELAARSGRRTVPQIWIGDHHVGGFDDLWMLDQRGQLDHLLAGTEHID